VWRQGWVWSVRGEDQAAQMTFYTTALSWLTPKICWKKADTHENSHYFFRTSNPDCIAFESAQ
jgi:hypothetical protein